MSSLGFSLEGQVALVTGGTSGIGKAIAHALLDAGARVVTGSRSEEKTRDAEAELADGREADRVRGTRIDVADRGTIDAAVGEAADGLGRIDLLVNCAGTNLKKPTLDLTDEEERGLMETNFFGPLYAAKAVARRMLDQGGPSSGAGCNIVNVCSVSSFVALTEVTPYACSKSALLALTRQLAVEWGPSGIRTNAIAPGFIPAEQNREILRSGDRGRRILENTPLERFGSPEETAGAVVYLASPAGRFVNGACLTMDGGFLANGVSEASPKDTA